MLFACPEDRDHGRMHSVRIALRDRMKALFGLEDTSGVEILALVRALARLCDLVQTQRGEGVELSGPRWGLLMLLGAHEQFGMAQGMTPTALSQHQGVSKNTTSSLLRGLEEQGYVERALDAADHRVFRIRLTDAGREVVRSLAPERMAYMNRLASGLSAEEREQLLALLEKLHGSIVEHGGLRHARHDA